MAAISCPLSGRMTVQVHYDSIKNAFEAGWRAAGGSPEELADILKEENLWLHDPRAENGLKEKPLARTGSKGRPKGSGSGGNGDPASKSRGGNNVEFANKPYNPECCARRHWNGGLVSEDGTQGGAQCINSPEEGGDFCAKCQKRYDASLDGKVDWHGSFSKTIQEDPGTKKDGSSHPWKLPKVTDEGEGTGLKKTSSKKKKAAKKPENEEKKSLKKTSSKKKKKLGKKKTADDPVPEEPQESGNADAAENPAEDTAQEKPEEETAQEKPDNPDVVEDDTDLIEIDGKQYIHDTDSDTIYTKEGEPVANWVNGKPEWFADNTEDMSEDEEESDEEDDSDEE